MPDQSRVLLLDVMETLVTEPFFTTMPGFFGISMEQLLRDKHPTSWVEFEKGRIDEAEYLRTFFLDGRPIDAAGLRACLSESYEWLEGVPQLLTELRSAGYPMYAVSNYSTWYTLIEEKLALSQYLDWRFVSCLTGLRKPDPQTYTHVVQSLQISAADCVFIDDRSVNVEAARELGMTAILRASTAQVRADLVQLGLLEPAG